MRLLTPGSRSKGHRRANRPILTDLVVDLSSISTDERDADPVESVEQQPQDQYHVEDEEAGRGHDAEEAARRRLPDQQHREHVGLWVLGTLTVAWGLVLLITLAVRA